MENNPTMWREILKNKVIQSVEFKIRESRCYNIVNNVKPPSGI